MYTNDFKELFKSPITRTFNFYSTENNNTMSNILEFTNQPTFTENV
jgi:hypothetical protein